MAFDMKEYDKELNLLVSLVGDQAGADHLLRTKDDLKVVKKRVLTRNKWIFYSRVPIRRG